MRKAFGLRFKDDKRSKVRPLSKKRVLIGKSDVCDICLDHPTVSDIHAVIDFEENGEIKLYDMNSANGTLLNGEKVVVSTIKEDDIISFGSFPTHFEAATKERVLPPVLDIVETVAEENFQEKKSENAVELPYIEYPLTKDSKAEFSEYIFEDENNLHKIFNYSVATHAVEVMILHKGEILSVDYIPHKNGVFNLVGYHKFGGKSDVEFAYLPKKEKHPLLEIKNSEVFVNPIPGHKGFSLDSKGEISSSTRLGSKDLIRFDNNELQVFVRSSAAPPAVKEAPLLRRDHEFTKFIALFSILVVAFFSGMTLFPVDKEIEKEKAPERIATILYKKKPQVIKKVAKPTPKIKKKVVKTKPKPTPKVAKKTPPKKTKTTKVAGSSKSKKTGQLKAGRPPKTVTKKAVSRSGGKTSTARKSNKNSQSKGSVDTFKFKDYSKSLNRTFSKGGSTQGVAKATGSFNNVAPSSLSGLNTGDAPLKQANVVNDKVGSLSGVVKGKLDNRKGLEGLVAQKELYMPENPTLREELLGAIDPSEIFRILAENLHLFRYCYQRELDVTDQRFDGRVTLNFMIGASGRVSKAGVDASNKVPGSVRQCLVGVLKGLEFPRPKGGGVVEVSQPFSLFPKRL